MTPRFCITMGCVLAGLGVAMGAFGAHALEARIPQWYPEPAVALKMHVTWEVAVRYQIVHSLALAMLGLWGERNPDRSTTIASLLFLLGMMLFSGLLYVLVLSGLKILGMIVPVGGISLLLGWIIWAKCSVHE